ncbi:MAG: hypothetical protein ABI600_12490 [Luteolibacter sp.]
MQSGSIINAVIRCFRQDSEAAGLFDLTRPDLGLWVLDLDYTPDAPQGEQIAEIFRQLQANSIQLQKLHEGSVDYTLHLKFDLPERKPIIIPPTFSKLASECGFSLELYASRDEEG